MIGGEIKHFGSVWKIPNFEFVIRNGWLPHQDSNLDCLYQKQKCYHYTMG